MQQQSNDLRVELVLCACKSLEHQVVLIGFRDEPEIYLQVHLNTYRNFWQRLWHGLKYAVGYKSKYGAWDEVILGQAELEQIKKFIENESCS